MDRRGAWLWPLVMVLWAATCGAVGCEADEERLPCPPGGIAVQGVADAPAPGGECSGGACGYPGECSGGICPAWTCNSGHCKHSERNNQMANFKRYACRAPQICPDMDIQAFLHDVGPASGARVLGFLLTNCSTGDQPLQIDKVIVHGDDRCSFSNVTAADIAPRTVPPGGTAAIRITYDPAAVGEDHAELSVISNAQNKPELRLRVCGLVVDSVSSSDGGTARSLQGFICEECTNQVACHK